MSKPSTPKGTRDFGPLEMGRRNYIFDTIKTVFKVYGFSSIETPAMELTKTLLGKYGEEGDRLIFRILPRGEKLGSSIHSIVKLGSEAGSTSEQGMLDPSVLDSMSRKLGNTEEALRYDLTVPFARFVVQHQNEISFPFKRYQIQPVWRADKPQKGRYREFYQCDADVVGSNGLLYEVELTQIFAEVLGKLNIPGFAIKINNRKILSGIAEVIGEKEKIVDITVAIDKLDKIGKDGVNAELAEKGIPAPAIEKLQPLIEFTGTNTDKLNFLKTFLNESEIGQKGIEELEFVFDKIKKLNPELLEEGAERNLELDITLARGLNYYTGAIWEVKAKGVSIGSICGGGRYDDLTGIFGLKGISGVGISFGADRIYDVLAELNLFPETTSVATKLLLVHFGEAEADFGLEVIKQVRAAGIASEIYPDQAKMKKQMGYANDKNVPFVGIIGGDEVAAGKVMLKNMGDGSQKLVSVGELIKEIGV
ncbi:MAG: histidine--tRNA ligase [Bacteroidota bacterium]